MSRAWHPTRYGVGHMQGRCLASGKLRFPNEHSVRSALAKCLTEAMYGNPRRMEMTAYRCTACGGWHMSSHAYTDQIVRTP